MKRVLKDRQYAVRHQAGTKWIRPVTQRDIIYLAANLMLPNSTQKFINKPQQLLYAINDYQRLKCNF
jgi:hypothetical protein